MFELSKRKRMQIFQQVCDKREKLPSSERRKLVQAEYSQFVKTMSNFKPVPGAANNNSNTDRLTKGSIPSSNELIKDSVFMSYSPTVGDIPKPPTDRQSLAQQFFETSQAADSPKKELSPDKMNQMNFYKQDLPQKVPVVMDDLNELKQEKSEHHSEVKVEDQEIKFTGNLSVQQSSVNNSDAIFFTSQFKEFIDRQNSPPKDVHKEELERIPEQQKMQDNKEQEYNQKVEPQKYKQQISRPQKTLKNNASGQSLALSNDSSLKLSFQESGVHETVARKLTHELVIVSMGNENYFAQSIRNLALSVVIKQNQKDSVEVFKQINLMRQINRSKKRKFYEELMVNHELFFELRKNEIKVLHHREQKDKKSLQNCFFMWREIASNKAEVVQHFIAKYQRESLQRCFRAFKMLLYDRKINNQIDLFYLSKIFMAFKTTAEKEKKKNQQKAYRFYFKNLKKRMFNHMIEGIRNHKRERESVEMADEQYYLSLLRRTFDAWKQIYPREQRYVRLAMTTKNQLRQTTDKRLFQTRTFDFTEIR